MKAVNLCLLREQYRGTRFCQLVQHHLRRQSQNQRIQGLKGLVAMLPESARGLVEEFIDRWNCRIYEHDFWQQDTAAAFDEILDDARNHLKPLGLAADDEAAFGLFNIIVMNYAYSAYDQPKMREFMGITGAGFPWPSALALLYPIAAVSYMAMATPAKPTMVMGYGFANLGYLLFAAGVWPGRFRILGLSTRRRVLGVALLSIVAGVVLSNIRS